jgi:hypothetical protein
MQGEAGPANLIFITDLILALAQPLSTCVCLYPLPFGSVLRTHSLLSVRSCSDAEKVVLLWEDQEL